MSVKRRSLVGDAGLMLALWATSFVPSTTAQTPPATPPPKPGPAAPQAPGTATGQKPAEAEREPYTYKPEGRRDPFVSLLSRGVERAVATKGSMAGIGGLATADLSVRGVLQSRAGYVAMVQGPDGKTHIAHVNDRLSDGVIKQITPEGLVILQEVNEPLSLVKQREVRKNLRSAEEGK